MTMKCCIVSAAAGTGTPTFTQDFTDSGVFGGATPVAAIFLGGGTGTADTATDGAQFQFGATDGTNYGAISLASDTSSLLATPSNTGRSNRSNAAYVNIDYDGAVVGVATASLIANGARLSWSNQSAGETISALLIGGDVEASLVNWSSPGGTGAKTITHGFSAAPDIIIVFGIGTVDATDGGGTAAPSVGFWTTGSQVGFGARIPDAVTTSALSARLSSTQALVSMSGTSPVYSALIENITATEFDLNFDASTTNRLHFLCLRSTSGSPLAASVGHFTAKTSTGTQVDVSSMTAAPQVMIVAPTALTAADGNNTVDPSGNFGVGFAVQKSSDLSTQYASVQYGADDGVATSADWMNHQISTAKHINQLSTAGATQVAATISTWDANGITHNYGTASGTAVRIPYLAFGAPAAASIPKARMLMTGVG